MATGGGRGQGGRHGNGSLYDVSGRHDWPEHVSYRTPTPDPPAGDYRCTVGPPCYQHLRWRGVCVSDTL